MEKDNERAKRTKQAKAFVAQDQESESPEILQEKLQQGIGVSPSEAERLAKKQNKNQG